MKVLEIKFGCFSRGSCFLSCHSSEQMCNTCWIQRRSTVTDYTVISKHTKPINQIIVSYSKGSAQYTAHTHLVLSASPVRYSSICGNSTPSIVTRCGLPSMLWWEVVLSGAKFSTGGPRGAPLTLLTHITAVPRWYLWTRVRRRSLAEGRELCLKGQAGIQLHKNGERKQIPASQSPLEGQELFWLALLKC